MKKLTFKNIEIRMKKALKLLVSLKSFMENFPGYKQNGNIFGAFGLNTCKAAEDAGIILDIKAPAPQSPGMVSALDKYLQSLSSKKK